MKFDEWLTLGFRSWFIVLILKIIIEEVLKVIYKLSKDVCTINESKSCFN